MNSNTDSKPEPIDPDVALRMLDLELKQKRAARQHSGTPFRGLRAASFIFLAAVLLGALGAIYYVISNRSLDTLRTGSAAQPAPSLAPQSPSAP